MLKLNDVVAGYDRVPALHGVSMEVREGEVVSVVGANGAGKSTLLRAISGLVRLMSGTIEFLGERIDRLPEHVIVQRAGIAHVPEGRRLFQRMTVGQNLIMGAYTQKSKEKRQEILEHIYDLFPRLRERHTQRAGTLSGGEQQMLAIARGLMLRPRLLMLDEPSMGVMPTLVERIFETVKQISQEGTTILLVEQNVTESLELADRGYVLQTGEIVATGTGRELLANPMVRRAYLGL